MKAAVLSLIENQVEMPENIKPQPSIIDDEDMDYSALLSKEETKPEPKPEAKPENEKIRKGAIEITNKIKSKKQKGKRGKTMFDDDLKLEYATCTSKLVDAIKKGYESYEDIEKASEMSKHYASIYFEYLYKAFLKSGFIQKTDKTHKQSVIDFIQSRLCDSDYKETANAASPIKEEKKPKKKAAPKQETKPEPSADVEAVEPVKPPKQEKQTSANEDLKTIITKILNKIDGKLANKQELLNAQSKLLDEIYTEFNNAGLLRR